jgi:hypothetical protein
MAMKNLSVRSIEPYESGTSWGEAGPYELVRGVVSFALDPAAPANARVCDLEFAERAASGLVEFEADFCLLRPADPSRANGGLFFSVANRGNVTLPFGLGPAPDLASLPAGTIPASDGFLLRRGWTVAWCGWQFDLARGPRQLALDAPQAVQDGQPIEGDFRIDLRATADSGSLRLLDGTAIMAGRTRPVYPPAGLEQPTASLSRRESPDGPRTIVPRERWRFAHEVDGRVEQDDAHVWCADGFKAGEIYELVYRTAYCPVAGVGMTAVRDFVSCLRHGEGASAGLVAPLGRTIGMGVSQTGRWLRQYLWDGFNLDEAGRQVFDGVFIHVAGGRTGEFNHRYAQPNEALSAGFADLPPRAWEAPGGGLLDRLKAAGARPKIFWVNSGWEYWRGDASLTHTTLDGKADIPNPSNVRSYLMAGLDHLGANTAMARLMGIANEPTGVDPSPLLRALFAHLEAWVGEDKDPPESRIPRVADGTAVPRETVLAATAKLRMERPDAEALPLVREVALGPDAARGVACWPATYGATHQTLVSAVDEDCNEVAGIRMPEQQAPVATLTGWNTQQQHARLKPQSAMPGSRVAFPKTTAERQASRDPRPSVEERYGGRDGYLRRITEATDSLVREGFILAEDREFAVESAMGRYDATMAGERI